MTIDSRGVRRLAVLVGALLVGGLVVLLGPWDGGEGSVTLRAPCARGAMASLPAGVPDAPSDRRVETLAPPSDAASASRDDVDCASTDVLGRLAALAAELRQAYDGDPSGEALVAWFAPGTGPPHAAFDRIPGRPPRRSRAMESWLDLLACAGEQGLVEPFAASTVATCRDEPRPPLRSFWLATLMEFAPCRADVFEVLADEVRRVLDARGDGAGATFGTYLMRQAACPDMQADVVGLLLSVAEATSDPAARAGVYVRLAASVPWNEAVERHFLEHVRCPADAWSSLELLYAYAGHGLQPDDVQRLLLALPATYDAILAGDSGRAAAWAAYKLMAQDGGAWGAQQLLALVREPTSAGRADVLAFLGDPAAMYVTWNELGAFVDDADPDVATAAWTALAQRLAGSDDALDFVRSAAIASDDPASRLHAIEALGTCGRADAFEILLDEVLPSASDAEARRATLSNASLIPGADLERIAWFADEAHETDPETRMVALTSYVVANPDVEASVERLASYADDPVLGLKAATAAGLYLRYAKGDEASLARWEQIRPPGFELAEWAMRDDLERLALPWTGDAVASQVESQSFLADLAEAAGHPQAQRLQAQARMADILRRIAVGVAADSSH
ncbi:MAG: HEAT repeat domain-containing protein [Planctomycetes bacterium]|nr:HEAT repeat domain-containing protein [Planctomycetota bacterium]